MEFKGYKIEEIEEGCLYRISKKCYSFEFEGTIGQAVDYANMLYKAAQDAKKAARTTTFDNEKYRANLLKKREEYAAKLQAAIDARDWDAFNLAWRKGFNYLTRKIRGPLYMQMMKVRNEE